MDRAHCLSALLDLSKEISDATYIEALETAFELFKHETPPLKVTREQAAAFIRALWPQGEQGYLANHVRTYLEAIAGDVPRHLHDDDKVLRALSAILRGLADEFDQAVIDDMQF